MMTPTLEWLVLLAVPAICAIAVPTVLKNLSSRRLQRIKRRGKDLFDLHTEAPKDAFADDTKEATEKIRLFYKGLKRVAIFIFGLLIILGAALPYFSTLPAALVSFFLGAMTLIIGTAAKPAIENFISGVVLAFSQTINIGDTVLIDQTHYGTIEDLGYTHCVVRIWDWRRYIIPNSEMLTKSFLNYSLHDSFLIAYVEFRVSPEADLDMVDKLCTEIPKTSKYYVAYEEPALWVMEMDKDSILCWCGAWADTPSDAWMLKSDIRNGLLRAFQDHGINTQSFRLVQDVPQNRPPVEAAYRHTKENQA